MKKFNLFKNTKLTFVPKINKTTSYKIKSFNKDKAFSNIYFNTQKRYYENVQRKATTILCIRKEDKVVMIGDGQVSMGNFVAKPNAVKIRQLREGIICGFAGATADAFALLDRLERKLDTYPNQLLRACVELAKDWRTDKYLRDLQATMIVTDANVTLEITGNGDVMESHDGILAIGSGGVFALSAARALMRNCKEMDAEHIAKESMNIAAELCIYTNHNFTIKTIEIKKPESK